MSVRSGSVVRSFFAFIAALIAVAASVATATTLVPAVAPHGARAVIVGTGLDAGTMTVTFASSAGSVPATIVSRSAALVEIIVASMATSGAVQVDVNGATIASLPFTLVPDAPFVKVATLTASDQAHDLLKSPAAAAVINANGTVVIADTAHHRILAVSPSGSLSLLAGGGMPGFADGSGAGAQFKEPAGIAVDQTRKVIYVSDTGNNAIRAVTYDGRVSTLVSSQGGLKQPRGLAVDSAGILYIADSGNDNIKSVTPAGVMTTFAGNVHNGFADGPAAQALFKGPEGVTVSASGDVFVADTQNNAIRKVANGVVTTVAGTGHGGFLDGAATFAEFKEPSGVALDDAGNLLVADTMNHSLRLITFASSNVVVKTISGLTKEGYTDGDPATAQFKQPHGIAFQGAAFVADTGNDALRVLYTALTLSAIDPRSGDPSGGTAVRLFGTGFVPGATEVSFGGIPASSIAYVASTELIATAPPHAAGFVDVAVATPVGRATLQNAFQYTSPFTALRITPASATLSSGQRQQFTATGVRSDNTTADLTTRALWSSSNPSVATIDASGLAVAAGSGTTTITATFENLMQFAQLTVSDLPPDPSTTATPIDPTVVSSISDTVQFLYSGPNPIQRGVAPGAIDQTRIAVIRGRVFAADGAPLPSARVSLLGGPQFGYTLTRSDGMYDLAVNGGGQVVIQYEKSGYIAAQRRETTPWRDFVVMEDVYLAPYDAAATRIMLGAAAMQVARGSVVSDKDGSRQATLLIPAGTTATIETSAGSQPAPALTVRATEFTVGPNGPKMMPANLPPASAYTYCVELSADEAVAANASSIRFSKPLAFYVENFLEFPVGGAVPLGYYDRVRAAWIAMNNGIVLRIVAVAGGVASIDLTGDGVPDDTSAIGITSEELQQLAALYQPGQTLWRVTTDHFTAFDPNFPSTWKVATPQGALAPTNPQPQHLTAVDAPRTRCGSVIDCQNQVYGDSIRIAGTPFALEYQSDEALGYQAGRTIDISISGATVPAPLKRIDLNILIMGRRFHFERPAMPNQSVHFTWDGLDAYGRTAQGAQTAHIAISYVYDAVVYTQPVSVPRSFGLYADGNVPWTETRQEYTLSQKSDVLLGGLTASPLGLGGWRIDAQQILNPQGGVLHQSPSETQTTSLQQQVMKTFAGGGVSTAPFGYATDIALGIPMAVAPAPDGSVYISEWGSTGVIRRVAGGVITTAFNVPSVTAMAVGADEALYFVRDGRLWRGDPASGAVTELPTPPGCCQALAVGPEGSLYIAGSRGIVRMDADATFSRLTGDSSLPRIDRPAGLPAMTTNVGPINGIAVDTEGSIYFSVYQFVYRIPPDGIIERFAGTSTYTTGFTGDGGPATAAELSFPDALVAAPDGSIYLTDSNTYTLRRVLPNGVITTVAGNPKFLDYSSDGTPAAASYIDFPKTVSIAPGGALYLCDRYLDTVRKIASPDESTLDGHLIVPSLDGTTASVFSSQGRHERTVDAVTGATLYSLQYNTAGRLIAIVDSYGNTTTIERDASGSATAIVSPFGGRTTLSISNGLLSSISNPAGERFEVTYTADGLLTKIKNPRGIDKNIGYDTLGRLVSETQADGGGLTIIGPAGVGGSFQVTVRSAEGQTMTHDIQRSATGDDLRTDMEASTQLKVTTLRKADGSQSITLPDGSNVVETIRGDPRFQSLAPLSTNTISTPSGKHSVMSIDRSVTLSNRFDPLAVRSLTQTLSLNGRQWQETYTATNRTTVSRTPMGRQVTTVFNSQSDPVSVQLAGFAAAAFSYNSKGQLAFTSQGTRRTDFAYNGSGFLERVTDPLGRSIRFDYDGVGRVTHQTLPDGRVIGFSYDADGNVTSVTPPSRPQHLFTFTPVDLEASYTPPDSAATRYEYNRDGRVALITRPDSSTIALGYDTAARLSATVSALGTHTYSYDPAGRLAKITAPDESTLAFVYDGPLITAVSSTGPIAGTVAYTYNSDLQAASESVNGSSIAFGYDADGLFTSAGALMLTRNAQNGLLSGTSIGSVSDTFGYDLFGDVTSYAATAGVVPLFSESFVRDDVGRIVQKSETFAGTTSTLSYSYDTAGHLHTVTSAAGTTTYDYDDNGNRLSRTTAAGIESGSYDVQDRMLTYGGATYVYSANGELQTRTDGSGTTTYAYDAFGNLRRVVLADGRTIDYVIDAANRRVGKKINGVVVQGWLYAGDRIAAETNATGTIVSRFVYGSRANTPDYMIRDGVTYRIITDQLGSVRLVVNAQSGDVASGMNYDEFGRALTYGGFVPFGFAGGLYDPDTQLTRFGARDYDPQTGRWTSKDPIGFGGGDANLYSYVQGDPVNLVDPSGLDALTNDPGVRRAFYDLWKQSGYGGDPLHRERSAWITQNPTTGAYGCVRWPWSATSGKETWNTKKDGPVPATMVAQAHTHPDATSTFASSPKPSTGGTKDNPHDDSAAQQINAPVYTISRYGIWKIDPQGNITQEAGPEWNRGLNPKQCTCQP
jgi:RHS repeat-associated protein